MATGTRLMQEISDQFLNCKICFESFREPKTLACLHTFCLDCLQQHYEQEASSRSTRFSIYTPRCVTCPLCRKKTELPTGGVRRLPDNFLVCNLNQVLAKRTVSKVPPCDICASVRAKNVDASSKCLDCTKLLCKSCVDLHLSTKVTQQHSLIDLEGEKDIVCKIHEDEIVKFYCEPCSACICVVCTFQEHRDHDVLTLNDGYTKYRGGLESLLERCKTRAEDISSRLSVIDKYETVVKDVRETIRDLAISSIAKVRAKERELLQRIDDVYGGEVQAFVESRPALQENLDDLEGACNLTDMMLRDKGVELLLIKRDIETKMEQLLQPGLQDVPSDPAVYDIRFVPGDVALGKLTFGDEVNGDNNDDDDDEIGKLKKKEQKEMEEQEENKKEMITNNGVSESQLPLPKQMSPQNEPDVITNCTQTDSCHTKDTATSMSLRVKADFSESPSQSGGEIETSRKIEETNRVVRFTDEHTSTDKNSEDANVSTEPVSNGLNTSRRGSRSDGTSIESRIAVNLGTAVSASRAQRRAERRAALANSSTSSLSSTLPTTSRIDRAPAPDLLLTNSATTSCSTTSPATTRSGAFLYTPGRMIRSRKIQTEISALDVDAAASNTDREFVQTMLQAELVAEKMRQEKELSSLSSRLRDRPRRGIRTTEMGTMTSHEVRIVPEMTDKETSSEIVQTRDACMQVVSESATADTQTPVVRVETHGTCTDREGQADKCTATQSVGVRDQETCTSSVTSEAKSTWTEAVSTSDRATVTLTLKLQHRAVGTAPTTTGTAGCQVTPQASAVATNTPVTAHADGECQVRPDTCSTGTAPDTDIERMEMHQLSHQHTTDQNEPAHTSLDHKPHPVPTCDRASDAYITPTCSRSTETPVVKLATSSTETPTIKLVDRDTATTETKTLDQWTETYVPTLINTGVTPPRPDTLDVGVATNVILTDEQATCTDLKSYRDTQTETVIVVCDSETLTEPVQSSDAQTCVDIHTESRHCETDVLEVADETCMTDSYSPWEAVDTASEWTQCDTAILRTQETNTAIVKRKAKESQTVAMDSSALAACLNGRTSGVETSASDLPAIARKLQENGEQTTNLGQTPGKSTDAQDSCAKSPTHVTQDVGTMAISCHTCLHEVQETAIQTSEPQVYDKSSSTSSDEHFLARSLSREYHDVATSTDSLPFIGLLSEINVDDLIIIPPPPDPGTIHTPETLSSTSIAPSLGERVIMVDDETSTDFMYNVETATQTCAVSVSAEAGVAEEDSVFGERGAEMVFGLGKDLSSVERKSNIDTGTVHNDKSDNIGNSTITSNVNVNSISNRSNASSSISDSCCPYSDDKHLVSTGVNTTPKLTVDRETLTSRELLFTRDRMTIYVTKLDKGTSTLNQVRIVEVKDAGRGQKVRSVDKVTMTSRVEQKEVAVETDPRQVDGRITDCITKLRSVSERLNSPTSTPPPRKEGASNNNTNESTCSNGNEAFFGKSFAEGEMKSEAVATNNYSDPATGVGAENDRQRLVQNLLEQTKALLKRKDISPVRKPQPITTLKGRKPAQLPPAAAVSVLMVQSDTSSTPSIAFDKPGNNDKSDSVPNTTYNSKSLPRGFTSERRSGTVKMGSQPLSPTRLPLHRYNSAPGRIATVPAHTLFNKTGGSGGAGVPKFGFDYSAQGSAVHSILGVSKDNASTETNNTGTAGPIASPVTRPTTIETQPGLAQSTPTGLAVADAGLTKPQLRRPLPSITETRTPSSCSDNSTASLHSSGSTTSARQSTEPPASAAKVASSPMQAKSPAESMASPRTLRRTPVESIASPPVQRKSSIPSPRITHRKSPIKTPPSPMPSPKRLAGLSIGAPTSQPSQRRTPQKEKTKSPTPKPKAHQTTVINPPTVIPASPMPRRAASRDTNNSPTLTHDPKRLSTQSAASPSHSRSSSTCTSLSLNMADTASEGSGSSRRSSKEKLKKSPSKEKMKSSASSETIQSSTSSETTEGVAKSKKSGGISFMQRFLSKKKKSEAKKEPSSFNTKTGPPTSEAVAALSILPAPVPAAPKESYAHVPIQHPPHHYVPQPEVKPHAHAQKPGSFVYVQQRLISIQHDNADDERKTKIDSRKKPDNLLVAHKQAMFAEKGACKDLRRDSEPSLTQGEQKVTQKDSGKGKGKGKVKEDKAKAEAEKERLKMEEREKAEKIAAEQGAQAEKEKPTGEKDGKEKALKSKGKGKKSDVKSASSWIRGKGDKSSKK